MGKFRLLCTAALFCFTWVVVTYAKEHPAWVTEYYKPFSRWLQKGISTVFSVVPFSAAEVLFCGIAALLLGTIVYCVVRIIRNKATIFSLFGLFSRVTLTASVFYLIFIGVWGLNYHASPLYEEWDLAREPRSAEVLLATAEELRDETNRLAPLVSRREDGAMEDILFSDLAAKAGEGWRLLADEKGYAASPAAPKPALFSEVMSLMGNSGVFIPFTGEPHVNRLQEVSAIPFTMCHEMAHAAGFAPEDEANYAAILACRLSPYAEFQYSGALASLVYCANALASVDYALYTELMEGLSPDVRADLAARSAFWKQYEGPVRDAASGVNDTYLRAMAQPAGVKSYGMVVDLLISDYLERTSEP
ncbi:DUF3810 domain-containing protein [Oscillospiraceae bacterium OttesenSCG-928-G22]|nr:DUF3810 domain-containing protein [Oscillospiraceae bacterium OttesenSCG-928-G22]